MSHQDHRPLNDIEAALAAWSPRPVSIDRDRLMFAAGKSVGRNEWSEFRLESEPTYDRRNGAELVPAYHSARGKRTAMLWRVSTCLSTAVALLLSFFLWQERGQREVVVEAEPGNLETVIASVEEIPKVPTASPSEEPRDDSFAIRRTVPPMHFAAGTYLAQRHRLLTTPVERWPTTTGPRVPASPEGHFEPRQPATIRSLLEEYLPRELETDPGLREMS